MPTFKDDKIEVHIADGLAGLSASKLLSNVGTFHIKVYNVRQEGPFFYIKSPEFSISLAIQNGEVVFCRNNNQASKTIKGFKHYFQILISWKPDKFQLAILIDGKECGNDEVATIETDNIYAPPELIRWARKFNLLSRTSYPSKEDFLSIFIESLLQINKSIKIANCYHSFWDKDRNKNSPKYLPKLEPQSMAGIVGFLQDHSIQLGYELIPESKAGAGDLDLLIIASLGKGGSVKIALEGENAHSDDLEHGLTDQLPCYMKAKDVDYGIYFVLWYKCKQFSKPKKDKGDLYWELVQLNTFKNIIIEFFDLSIPIPPSNQSFEFE